LSRDDIIRMAREAGFNSHHNPDLYDCMVASDKAIERFADLVAAAEREKFCAVLRQLHDSYSLQSDPSSLRERNNQ
jgi:hypothetical protein